ncbi:hypothetical protein [Aeromonas media]|uniref:hypothetical protein n=1 Tax=Aeromonas media TaxID=651 RepID=UPI0029538CF8|nr:hypothetical protein [Aeromonas media]WOQ15175.1 hypothetical protein R2X36_10160 [Aeromonas media]
MNTQDNFITAVKEVKSYMYHRRNYLTDEQSVLIEGELTMFLTNAFIKQAEAEKKEETYTERFTRQLEQHRDLIQCLLEESKSNRV